ncbi:uncharacterized protein LOC118516404 [Anopheles stephensi]|uniref:uncharacterized protein LOC118516404 n=1 Tax=Anopheles stephensi TaxID=30069 RepID=UPI001658A2C2|nr:uncharacterized protein LOC118516404 [Anopheles stephensi]
MERLVEEFTRVGLVRKCEMAGLATSGSKEDLAKRIMDSGITLEAVPEQNPIEDAANTTGYMDAESGSLVDATKTAIIHTPVQPYSFRDVEDGIEPYGADLTKDIRAWFDDFEGVAKMALWSEDQMFIMCRRKMVGIARSFLATEKTLSSYPVLRSKLIKEFEKIVRSGDVHRRLMARRKTHKETMLEYVYEMQRIARDADIDECSLIEYIVDGVTHETRMRASLYRTSNMTELKQELLFLERAEAKRTSEKSVTRVEPRSQRKCYNCGDVGHEAKKCVKEENPKKCFECGGVGHRARECDSRTKGPKCYSCGERGHVSNSCPRNRNRHNPANTNLVSSENSGTVDMRIGQYYFKTLFDTGSEYSLLQYSVMNKIGSLLLAKTDMLFNGFGGKKTKALGRVETEVCIDGQNYPVMSFYVVPDNSSVYEVILGRDALCAMDALVTAEGVKLKPRVSENQEQCDVLCANALTINGANEVSIHHQYRNEIGQMIEDFKDKEKTISKWSSKSPVELEIVPDGQIMPFRHAPSRLPFVQEQAVNKQDDQLKAIMAVLEKAKYDPYKMKNGLLHRAVEGQDLLVVPRLMERQIISDAHNAGHIGVQKMMHGIRQKFWIPHLEMKVRQHIGNCVPCILHNKKLGLKEGYLSPIPKGDVPLHTLHMDHVGPMDTTAKQYRYILTIVDSFSKFVWLYPTRTTTAEEVLRKLECWSAVFGNPTRIITDRGSAFTSNTFAAHVQNQSIEHIVSTTGVPRGNGQAERVNRTAIEMLAKLSTEDPSKWFKWVNRVQRAINSYYHSTTGKTPFELMFGVKMKNSSDDQLREIINKELYEYHDNVRQELRKDARIAIEQAQRRYKHQFDKKRKPASGYKLGELVAIKRTQFVAGKKLASEYLGPYEIMHVNRNGRYRVRKVGLGEGPLETSTSEDNMRLWAYALTAEEGDDEDQGSDFNQDDRM